ncbi:HNH endonuclease [Acidovorax delafieldii 2AN]|uniref:HNH endonuclease n=1 Tax=Acidovorax delafieldii 2AN TaxID=573060 RepID=C5T1S7_ACIDE|nr:HNH endonuclease signature motif containing protein [Acidovorax delafieldii]EER61522.1 HNH endonuclease [Acidovorax delafieldii 2AN]
MRWLLILLALTSLDATARIDRDRAQVRAFRAENPYPATGRTRGACPGYHVDHITPLCAGGADRPENMQWITREDHRFKTLVDVRECRKLERAARRPAG